MTNVLSNINIKKTRVSELLKRVSDLTLHLSEEVRANFTALTPEQLFWKPNERAWSIAQCLAHLNAYYSFYIPVFKERIKNTRFRTPGEYFVSSPLGTASILAVKLGKVKNVKRRLKAAKDYNPLVNATLKTENAVQDFLDYQDEMLKIIAESRFINIRKAKCSLAVTTLIKLRLGDAFQLVSYHNERHVEQAKNVMKTPGFPKGE
ncbi:MAG: DinB family protein [Crocinitomicaceae bacterium]|nr:DinB family protein [Crocinitomicaceae bacterium]